MKRRYIGTDVKTEAEDIPRTSAGWNVRVFVGKAPPVSVVVPHWDGSSWDVLSILHDRVAERAAVLAGQPFGQARRSKQP